MAKIVYHRYFNRDKYPRIQILSSQVLLFLGGNAYCALTMMPYYAYTSVRWSPDQNYDIDVMFWLGMQSANYFAVVPVLVFFLTLDRCLALRLPLLYASKLHKWTTISAILVMAFVYFGSTFTVLLELPLQYHKLYDCKFLTCASLKFKSLPQYVCKLTFGSANLVLTLYFLWITRSSVCKQSIVTGETSTKYLGVYPSMFVSMDAAFCGIYYFIVLSKTKVHPASISS